MVIAFFLPSDSVRSSVGDEVGLCIVKILRWSDTGIYIKYIIFHGNVKVFTSGKYVFEEEL